MLIHQTGQDKFQGVWYLPACIKDLYTVTQCGAPGTVLCVKSVPGYCITFIKRLDENLS